MTPIDYNDPNDPWRTPGYDPYKGMSDKQKFLASLGQLVLQQLHHNTVCAGYRT